MRHPRTLRGAVLAACVAWTVAGMSSFARADNAPSPSPLVGAPAWTHANALDYALATTGLTELVTETIVLQNRSQPARWVGPILFDTAARDVFHDASAEGRQEAADVSWGLWFALVGQPLVVDVPYAWARYGRSVAWDLLWQDATALSLSAAVDFALRDSVARLRPYNTQCLDDGGTNCLNGPEATRSFPSGHVSETTTATALICTQHLTMHLYGAPWDAVTCASAVTADVTVAVLRMVADDHWASDILGGAALGAAFGWGVPYFMHLRGHSGGIDRGRDGQALALPVPIAINRGAGLGVAGFF